MCCRLRDAPNEKKRLSALTLALAGLVLILGIAWATGVIVQDRRALHALRQQIDSLTPEVDQVLAQQSEADHLAARITVLKTETDKHVLPLLSRLSDTIPTDMYLNTLRYKDGGIELSGVATSKSASELIATLNAFPCLKNVAPKAPFTTTAQGETLHAGRSGGTPMRRVIQLWQRLSPRERLLAGAAGAFVLLVALRFGIVEPFLDYRDGLTQRIQREAQRVQHMHERRESSPQVASRVQQLRDSFSTLEGRFVPGDTPALAAARMQERLQSLAGQSGLKLVTMQVMKEESLGEFQKALVQVTLSGELSAVASFLAEVEYSDWLLSVSTLEIRSPRGGRRRRARRMRARKSQPAQTPPRPLTVTVKVGGIMKKGTAS